MSKFIISGFADEAAVDLITQMDVFEELDIKYIEMRGVNGNSLVNLSLDEVREIKRELDERGFKISAVGSPIGKIMITDVFEPHLELFKHTIEIAKILETKYIRMFSFYIPEGENPDSYSGEVMKRWSKFVKAAANCGIILAHENQNCYGDTAERCLNLMKTMNCSYVKSVIDPGAFLSSGVEAFPHAYNLLKDYIAYIHIKDGKIGVWGQHELPGEGDAKIKELITELHSNNFEGFLSLEPHLIAQSPKDFVSQDASNNNKQAEVFISAANALKKIVRDVTGKDASF